MSSNNIAVSVRGLSKSYTIAHNDARPTTAAEALMQRLRSPLRRPQTETFWALRDLSFDIPQGEVVGVIGRNGAGKSTLLKVLSRITEPTRGEAVLRGRVGSLLEVGTGFHAELTGRENIYLNGAILGMTRREIARQFDAIVDFAGVEKFLDTPVKRYSSGMYVRLAFAVAAHLNPEILIVDEVLAVGDAEFQKKCLGKMQDVAEKEGRTVFFVSHNMQAISALTQRCLVLSGGKGVYLGPTRSAISHYLRDGGTEGNVYVGPPSPTEPRVTRVEIQTTEPSCVQQHGQPLELRFEITTPEPINGAALACQIFNEMYQPILHLLTMDSEIPMCRAPGTHQISCRISNLRMYPGRYSLTLHLAERAGGRHFQTLESLCPFEVVVRGELREHYWLPGAAAYVEPAHWQVGRPASSETRSVLAA